jgi:hypothetical protein
MKKAILFLAFVVFAYLLFMLSAADRNVESFPIDPTGKYYNPY